jgi:hypothetical protein
VAESEVSYFVLNGAFVGSYAEGAWRSLNDPGGKYDAANSQVFYFKDILAYPRFTLYAREGKLGYADEVIVNGGEGVSGFSYEEGDKSELFAKYAEPDVGNTWPYAMTIKLPADFGPEMDDLTLPDYAYNLKFAYGNVDLATNSESDLNPYDEVYWTTGDTYDNEEHHNALQTVLASFGIEARTNITEVAHLNRNGVLAEYIFANNIRDEDGYLERESEGVYAVILRHQGGVYETVFAKYSQPTEIVAGSFQVLPVGIFDLNRDGEHEVCAMLGEWEGGYTMVLSRDKAGGWQTVLRGNWGM